MSALVAVGLGCAVLEVDARFRVDGDAIVEETRALILVEDPARCRAVRVPLPLGAGLQGLTGKAKLSDGTRRRFDAVRYEQHDGGRGGDAEVVVHIPDLLPADKVSLSILRVWDESVTITQRADRFRLRAPSLDVTGPTADEGGIWTTELSPEQVIAVGHASIASRARLSTDAPVATGVETRRQLTLLVPPGDPQVRLHPGGGSSFVYEEQITFPPAPTARTWFVPLPSGHRDVEVRGEVAFEVRTDGVFVQIDGSEARTKVGIRAEAPDAPTCGEAVARPGETLVLEVRAPGGTVAWEQDGRVWWLVGWGTAPVLPSREALVKGLSRRFSALSMPEPGLPMEVRGVAPGWTLVDSLRPLLYERVEQVTWPQDPLWPRKPIVARKSGLVTETEVALMLALFAIQAKMPAEWVLVRPARDGDAPAVAPVGYRNALVRVYHEDHWRWIDPGCAVCGPFEIRPALEGASALSPTIDRTPDPSPGRLAVNADEEVVTWVLEGSAALSMRLWLAGIPEADRRARLARRMAGEGAELSGVSGLSEPGAVIRATALGEPQVPFDRMVDWVDWVGERTWTYPGDATPEVADAFVRTAENGRVTETWTVTERRLQ